MILIVVVVEDTRKKFKEMCREKYYIHIEFYLEDTAKMPYLCTAFVMKHDWTMV